MIQKLSMAWLFVLAIVCPALAGGGALNLSVEGLVWALVYIIIVACIVGLLWWLLNYVSPLLGEPIARIARIAFMVLVVLVLIIFLLRLLGSIH